MVIVFFLLVPAMISAQAVEPAARKDSVLIICRAGVPFEGFPHDIEDMSELEAVDSFSSILAILAK